MIRLDLADIQGNIHRPYGRFGFPHTRHFFFNIANASAGRRFVQAVRPRITTAEPGSAVEESSLEGGGFGTREAGMTVTEIFLLFRLTLNAITWVPCLSPFACFVVITAVSTWAPFASAARPGTRRMAVPGLGPGSMS